MPGLNGIETARKMRTVMKETKIIFFSSSNEHYGEAYDVFAFNYLLKPINQQKLNDVLDQALLEIHDKCRQQISFIYKAINYRIFCSDILYTESRNKIICFHMNNNTTLRCYAKLDDILKQLPEESFIRCHQSFAVNIFYVTELAGTHFCIQDVAISISKKYLKSAKDKYFTYLFDHMNNKG
jgi:DNA-binding LytR/AlgR family response regulator